MKTLFFLFSVVLFSITYVSCHSGVSNHQQAGFNVSQTSQDERRILLDLNGDTLDVVELSNDKWQAQLSKDEYYILREHGTERAFTSDLLTVKDKGVFVCAACQLPLFTSDSKFKSGTGWPSFYEPFRNDHIIEHSDRSYGMVRTEVRCARCDGHQGHVFPDGPQPTGLRYCINGDALDFVARP